MSHHVPNDRYYNDADLWAKSESTGVRVGITDFAQSELNEIVFVEVPAVGQLIVAGQSMGDIESIKTTSELIAPISGRVTERNGRLDMEPELVNLSPYGDGWLVVVEPNDRSEVERLMDGSTYAQIRS